MTYSEAKWPSCQNPEDSTSSAVLEATEIDHHRKILKSMVPALIAMERSARLFGFKTMMPHLSAALDALDHELTTRDER